MSVDTIIGETVSQELLQNYFRSLVNHFFKILPIRENEPETLPTYLQSLRVEVFGCRNFITELGNDPVFLTLLSILQYLIDEPGIEQREVRREVFRAIGLCNKLKATFSNRGVS